MLSRAIFAVFPPSCIHNSLSLPFMIPQVNVNNTILENAIVLCDLIFLDKVVTKTHSQQLLTPEKNRAVHPEEYLLFSIHIV